MVVSCHTGCVWDRATTTFKLLMDHASGTVELSNELTNVCSWVKAKTIHFNGDQTKSSFMHLTNYLE
jgi:hypothetical protein